ncbi:MAG: glycosyltransferase [Bacteroidia bacterium]
MKKIKLLRVISSMDPKTGGPPNGIKYITPFLDELNIETTIVCLDNINDEFIKKTSLNIVALNENKTTWQYNSRLYNWLLNNLINYDAVIVHGIWLYHTYAVSKAVNTLRKTNELFKTKYFIFPHGMLDGYFQSNKTRKLKAFRNYFYWHLVEHKNVAIADGLIFTSEEEKNIASKTFANYKPKQTLNLGYGIDVPINTFKQTGNKDYFIFLGRYDEKKGIDTIINTYKKLVQENSTIPKLVIAGPGLDAPYGQYIQRLVNESDVLGNHVELKEMVSGEEKWKLLANAKAMILWSHQENFGISVAESLGLGIPVLLSKQVNIWTEIVSNKAGLAEDDTEENLINVIKSFCKLSEYEYEQMCINAMKTYENNYKPHLYVKRLQTILLCH